MPIAYHRTATIQLPPAGAQRAEGEEDLYDLALSSEAPYERWFGIEVLRHSADAVDLTRLADGRHPLLLDHDTRQQIGVIRSVSLDADRVLRARVQFSRSAKGAEIRQDVDDGIRSLVSIGYLIDEIEEQDAAGNAKRTLTGDEFEREMRAIHGEVFTRSGPAARAADAAPPTFVVTRWTPFEGSIVAVPADVSVGVGRAAVAGAADPAPAANGSTAQAPTPPAAPADAAPTRAIVPATVTPQFARSHRMTTDTKTPAELEIERRDAIAALGEQYAKYLKPNDVRDAIQTRGLSVEAFKDLIIERMQSKHTDASQAYVGMTEREAARYSFGRALVAAATGDWTKAGLEREASAAVAKIMGRQAEGFYLPPDVFRRDFNIGTSTEAGNLKATELRADMFTDALRNNLVMSRLGVTFLAGLTSDVDLPRKSTAGTLGMVSEIGSASETNPLTTKATLAPKRISAYTEVSKQALIQSGIALEAMIRDDLVMGAAVQLESQAINGTGANNITGLRYVSGIGTVVGGTNGAAPAWSHFVDLESACANANAEPDRVSGYLLNTKTRGKLKQTQFATNLPMIWQPGDTPLNGYRVAVTNNVPSNITKGTSTTVCSAGFFGADWSMVTVGLFGAPDVTVDPYSKADTGQVKITLNQFADMQHRQPGALAHIADLVTG